MTNGAGMQVESISLVLENGEKISCKLRRSGRARRMRLAFSESGELSLTMPPWAQDYDIRRAIPGFMPWLEKTWPAFRGRAPFCLPVRISFPAADETFAVSCGGDMAAARRMSAGAAFSRIFCAGAARIALLERDGDILLFGRTDDARFSARALCWWCRRRAQQFLPPFLLELAGEHGRGVAQVLAGDQRTLWGSCSTGSNGRGAVIRLNWRAMLLDIHLLAHLCWHELCHIEAHGHSRSFHELLESRSPGHASLEQALGRAWRGLPAWCHA